jgi:hypothetical protein
LDASTIARAARGARRPAALSRPETDAAADDDGRSCLANLPMAEILETGTRPEAASTRRAPLEHAGTARIEARDAISDVSLGFEPPQTRRGPDAPWRRSERREGEGARDVTSSRRKNRRSTDARGPRRSRATPDGDALRAPRGEKRRSANAAARRTMATSRPARASRRKRRLRRLLRVWPIFFAERRAPSATRNVSTRVSGLGTPRMPDHVRPAATSFFPRVRLKTHTNGKTHDAGKITQERRSLSALRKGPEFDLFSSVGVREGRRSTEASVRVRPSDVRLRSLRRRSRISAPRRDDSAARLGAVAPRSSRGAPRC